jgi:ribonuclease T2
MVAARRQLIFAVVALGSAAAAWSLPLVGVTTARAAADDDCILDHCADQVAPHDPKQKPEVAKPVRDQKPDPGNDIEPPQATAESDGGARPRGASRPGDFDFYVLSLSWSPGFCATGGRARSQCADGANLGFVVHGLWPQYEHGFPSDCGPSGRYPSRVAVQSAQGLYPDDGLARYEWRRHGTCSGKSPTDYYADVRRAHDAVSIPPSFQSAPQQQSWTPVDIERAFIAANPRLKPGMLAVACRSGVLEEVRICFSKDLREFQACPEVARADCRGAALSVPPMR